MSTSRTRQEVQRSLLTADECMRLPSPLKDAQGLITEPGEMLICAAGFSAVKGRQPLYFEDPVVAERAAIKPAARSDALRPDVPRPAPEPVEADEVTF